MSRRALRRLRGEQRGQEPIGPSALQFDLRDDDDAEEEGPKRELGVRRPGGAGKEGVRVNNRFELVRSAATRVGAGWPVTSRGGTSVQSGLGAGGRHARGRSGDVGPGCSGEGGAVRRGRDDAGGRWREVRTPGRGVKLCSNPGEVGGIIPPSGAGQRDGAGPCRRGGATEWAGLSGVRAVGRAGP